MKESILIVLVVLLASFTSQALESNRQAFKAAQEAINAVDTLIKNGATDSDCEQVDTTMVRLANLRPLLSSDQQKALWNSSPYWAGIACAWTLGHAWAGNDCSYQCGSLAECQKGDNR